VVKKSIYGKNSLQKKKIIICAFIYSLKENKKEKLAIAYVQSGKCPLGEWETI
jgi:hypothetical protein